MFGILVGTVCLVLLIKVLKHGGLGCHPGRSWLLRGLFRRLDTTPGQEKVISSALEEVQKAAEKLREAVRESRAAVAKAIRGEHLDQAAVKEVSDRQQEALDALRKAILEGLQAVHEVLTPEQRSRLGDLLEHGACGWRGGCGPRWHGCGRGFAHGGAVNL
ncbi:MAG: Spy/CpxP family protein refolding chaperone [Myxococcales bacterium]|nr:Spy/CpxP family protein refolding chaperone [Myxococcales bacterium]